MFRCPACVGDPSKKPVATLVNGPTDHHLVPTTMRFYQVPNAEAAVFAYEPLTNHDGKGACFLYHDGHVEWKDATAAKALIAQLRSASTPNGATAKP